VGTLGITLSLSPQEESQGGVWESGGSGSRMKISVQTGLRRA